MALDNAMFTKAIRDGLKQAGIPDAETAALAEGLKLHPSLAVYANYQDEINGARLVAETAKGISEPIVQARRETAQAAQAAAETADRQAQSVINAKLAKAIADPTFDKLWQESNPAEHLVAWKDYIGKKARDPRYSLATK